MMVVIIVVYMYVFPSMCWSKVHPLSEKPSKILRLQIAIFSFDPQVSEEAPTFATDSKFGDLLVVVVPRQGPRIVGAHERFFINVHDNVMTV